MTMTALEIVKMSSDIAGPVLTGLALVITTITAWRLHGEQQRSARRQRYFSLWEKLVLLNRINPKSPIEPDVRLAINTLELVAASWFGNVVDRDMIDKSFRRQFLTLHESLIACNPPPDWGYSPKEEITKSNFIPALRTELERLESAEQIEEASRQAKDAAEKTKRQKEREAAKANLT